MRKSVKTGHIIAETVAIGAISALIIFVFETNDEIINDIPKSIREYINMCNKNSDVSISIGIIISAMNIPIPDETRIQSVKDIPNGM